MRTHSVRARAEVLATFANKPSIVKARVLLLRSSGANVSSKVQPPVAFTGYTGATPPESLPNPPGTATVLYLQQGVPCSPPSPAFSPLPR